MAHRLDKRDAPWVMRTYAGHSSAAATNALFRRNLAKGQTGLSVASDLPKWNPVNICSYHLQEAGATPVQEVGFALATAVAVLDAVRDAGQVPRERFGDVVARISFFVNAGVRFVEELAKMRAFTTLWDEIT